MLSCEKVIYTNEQGQSVELSFSSSYILERFDGRNGLKNNVISNKGIGQSGTTFIANDINVRYITLSGKIFDTDREYCRTQMTKAFNLFLKGELKYINTQTNTVRTIECSVEYCKIRDAAGYMSYDISLKCCSPFFKGTMAKHEMALIVSKLEFPCEFTSEFEFGEYLGDEVVVTNKGDVINGCIITYENTGKIAVDNPYITNLTTDERIKVFTTLIPKEKLIISTEYGSKRVTKVDVDGVATNVFGNLDITSKFFDIQIGENRIKYGADGDTSGVTVYIEYANQYLGV